MKKLGRTLPIMLGASAILGILAVSGHAKRPSPGKPEAVVTVAGAISGTGDRKAIQVTFDSSLAYEYPGDSTKGLVFISIPDGSLKTYFNPPDTRPRLRYYYCTHEDHEDSADLICSDASHSPDYYYCLRIGGGILQRKGREFYRVTFPVGSPWYISWKKDNSTVAQGTLGIETTYDIAK